MCWFTGDLAMAEIVGKTRHECIAYCNTLYYNAYITASTKYLKGGVFMAGKTANVMARVEPEVKEEAERIMSELGIPASVVINMLYKQIIYTKSIPFSVRLPKEPVARDAMGMGEFDGMMERGLEEAQSGKARVASDVFREIRQEI